MVTMEFFSSSNERPLAIVKAIHQGEGKKPTLMWERVDLLVGSLPSDGVTIKHCFLYRKAGWTKGNPVHLASTHT